MIAFASIVAIPIPIASWIDTVLAVILFVDAVVLTRGMTSAAWHNAIVAVVVFLLSLLSRRARVGVIR